MSEFDVSRENQQNDGEQLNKASLQFDATCPSCSASIEFNPSSGKLKCPYCLYEVDIAAPELEQNVVYEQDFSQAEIRGNKQWGMETKTIICKECSAETIYDALQVADACPYCGSHQVMEANDQTSLAPNGMCAFTVSHQQAAEKFHDWIKGKWFMPSDAKKSAKPDAFNGLYLPYWTFDTQTSSTYSAKYGIDRYVRDDDGDTRIETDWYNTSGIYQFFVDDHLVRASNRYDHTMMKQIEPFNLAQIRAYQAEYLSGYAAERYSVGLDAGWRDAQQEISDDLHDQIEDQIKARHGADRINQLRVSTSFDAVTYKYLMLPIWISSFQYKNKPYQFMVNGQTGKVGGKTPISAIRVTIAVIVALLIILFIFSISQN